MPTRRNLLSHAVLGGLASTSTFGALAKDPLPAPPAEVLGAIPGARLIGSGRLRYFGFSVYDASLWALPDFIEVLESAGFSAVRHRLHFQSLMSLPVLAVAMALLAAGFSMRQSRRGGVAQMLAAGVAAGFLLFVLDKITGEFGEAGSLPVTLAAWAPTIAGLLLALALLLHLEDG